LLLLSIFLKKKLEKTFVTKKPLFDLKDDTIKEMILNKASASAIKNQAVQSDMQTLMQDGWQRVKQGLTTPSEVIRVTKEENN